MARAKPTFTSTKKDSGLPGGGKIVPLKPGKNRLEETLSSPETAKKLLSPAELKAEKKIDDSFHMPREKREKLAKIKTKCYNCEKSMEVDPIAFNRDGMNICDNCLNDKPRTRKRQ